MKQTEDPAIFRLLTEVGIIEQLARNQLERSLPDGLKAPQFGVLNHLARLGGAWSPLRLANAFQVTKGAMTNTLQRLETRGLIKVAGDPEDGRGKLVTLTAKGRAMRARCVKAVGPTIAALSLEVSEKEVVKALPVLAKIRQHLDNNRS